MTAAIAIQNLKCGGCAKTIMNNLSQIENLSNIHIDLENDMVHFEHTSEEDAKNAENILIRLGYPPADRENSVMSKAKSFVSCAKGRMH